MNKYKYKYKFTLIPKHLSPYRANFVTGSLELKKTTGNRMRAKKNYFFKNFVISTVKQFFYLQSPEGTVSPSAGTSFTANLKDTYQASLLNRLYPSFVSFPLPDFTSISIVAVSKVHVGLTSEFTQLALPQPC
jgi:hypothetical protein